MLLDRSFPTELLSELTEEQHLKRIKLAHRQGFSLPICGTHFRPKSDEDMSLNSFSKNLLQPAEPDLNPVTSRSEIKVSTTKTTTPQRT
ncbi:hypothetical protein ElyMa_001102400 [Elysia marginata]|uniref:Uncharacterized protein n=1 Tax=Elysia marginata TaxID=1093978 RepID=A0AAV4HW01_9GAST|nr:hypothetical protein ElyMa_001102400 [Elysia marginata]